MDQELHHELRPRGVEHYRREAKALLRAVRRGDPAGAARARDALGDRVRDRFVLADALHVVAVEHRHRSWPAFKHDAEASGGRSVRPVCTLEPCRSRQPQRPGPTASSPPPAQRTGRDPAAPGGRAAPARRRLGHRHTGDPGDRPRVLGARVQLACLGPTARPRPPTGRGAPTTAGSRPSCPGSRRRRPSGPAMPSGCARCSTSTRAGAGGPGHDPPGGGRPARGRHTVPREVVDLLVEAGSALDDPLSIAACFDKPDLVGWLLDAGADPAARHPHLAAPERRLPWQPCRRGRLVRRSGVVPDTSTRRRRRRPRPAARMVRPGRPARSEALSERPNFSDVGWPGRALRDDPEDVLAEGLALAARLGRAAACELLLDHGADPARAPIYGLTPLHFAVSMGHLEVAELLVQRGAPLDPGTACTRAHPSAGRCTTSTGTSGSSACWAATSLADPLLS